MPLLLAGLALAYLVMLLLGGAELDRSLLILMHGAEGTVSARWAAELARVSDPLFLTGAAGAGAGVLLYRRAWRRAASLGAVIAGGLLLAALSASATAGLRPSDALPQGGTAMAFPDPGTAAVTLVALALALLLPRRPAWRDAATFAASALAFAHGVARLLTGAAWPTDVIGAWALALCWTLLLLRLAGAERDRGTDGETGEPGVTRVRNQDKADGANLPRFNEK
jgi:membrane-associated phospholipid phosphatase